jgi:hypothetical protein
MFNPLQFAKVLICLSCSMAVCVQAEPGTGRPEPMVVYTQDQWHTVLASGAQTPLDALTPYGKRRFIRSLRWGQNGLGGFSIAPLVRELNIQQLAATLQFLNSASYLPMLGKGIVGAPLHLQGPSTDVEQRLGRLEEFSTAEADKRSSVAPKTMLGTTTVLRRYQELFGPRMERSALQRQPLGDLLPLFDAATLATSDDPGSVALSHMLLVHHELATRGIDTSRTLDKAVLTAMLGARRFEQARTFATTRPHLAHTTIPTMRDPLGPRFSGRSVLDYDATRNTLMRQAVPYYAGAELVMVVGAGCHFSRDALDAIRSDPVLQASLREAKLVLITPPRSAIDFDFVTDWNTANPSMPIRIPYNAEEWQSIDVVGVPEFYLLVGGKVTGQLRSGWPAGGNRAALINLIGSADQ